MWLTSKTIQAAVGDIIGAPVAKMVASLMVIGCGLGRGAHSAGIIAYGYQIQCLQLMFCSAG